MHYTRKIFQRKKRKENSKKATKVHIETSVYRTPKCPLAENSTLRLYLASVAFCVLGCQISA